MDQGIPSDTPLDRVYLGLTAIVASEPMRQLMEMVERVGRSNATTLVTGESGAGKEMVARALHYYSRRAQRPWVDLSCAALPEQLLESELFGHERGAFSGAEQAKPGLFELAHQGTIFLDEIGELDPRMQVKLLRVLDGVPYYRLGGVRKVAVDVRVVAATNQNLERAVAEGRFRGDLYHRLSQVTLHVPPLRERVDDIEPLARHFLALHDPCFRLGDSAVAALRQYRWPGNIRELRNAIIQAAVLSNGPEIQAKDLLFRTMTVPVLNGAGRTGVNGHSGNGHSGNGQVANGNGAWGNGAGGNGEIHATNLEDMERQMILEALAASGGHQQKAAARLGISRRTLSRKLKTYQANEPQEVAS